jgi:hypothetical protein
MRRAPVGSQPAGKRRSAGGLEVERTSAVGRAYLRFSKTASVRGSSQRRFAKRTGKTVCSQRRRWSAWPSWGLSEAGGDKRVTLGTFRGATAHPGGTGGGRPGARQDLSDATRKTAQLPVGEGEVPGAHRPPALASPRALLNKARGKRSLLKQITPSAILWQGAPRPRRGTFTKRHLPVMRETESLEARTCVQPRRRNDEEAAA